MSWLPNALLLPYYTILFNMIQTNHIIVIMVIRAIIW